MIASLDDVNSTSDPDSCHLDPGIGNLGALKKQQFAVIIGKLLFFDKHSLFLVLYEVSIGYFFFFF